jgi:hypothetical protein
MSQTFDHDAVLDYLPSEGFSAQDPYFYNPFDLPLPDSGLYKAEEKVASIIEKIQPITEPVKITRFDDKHLIVKIGLHTAVLNKSDFHQGVACELGTSTLGGYTIVTVSGNFVKRSDYQANSNLVLAFSQAEHAEQFKNDLLLAYLGGESLESLTNPSSVETYRNRPSRSLPNWQYASMVIGSIVIGIVISSVFIALAGRNKPESAGYDGPTTETLTKLREMTNGPKLQLQARPVQEADLFEPPAEEPELELR